MSYKLGNSPLFNMGLDLAENLIKWYHTKEGNELISFYFKKYDNYVEAVGGERSPFEKLREALTLLHLGGELGPEHFLAAYINIFNIIDKENEREETESMVNKFLFDITWPVPKIVTKLKFLEKRFPRVVPMTTKRGLFGFNTFMRLFSESIYPIGCSLTPYPVHEGIYVSLTSSVLHDLLHLKKYVLLTSERGIAENVFDNLGEYEHPNYIKEWTPNGFLLKELYESIINSNLSLDYKKSFIYLLFHIVHEEAQEFSCARDLHFVSEESLNILLHLKPFTPEFLGLSKERILDEMKRKEEYLFNLGPVSRLYLREVGYAMVDTICQLFSDIVY